jgi:hypothetical protein
MLARRLSFTVDRAEVLMFAPDDASRRAAEHVRGWLSTGATGSAVWGECAGSGAKPYRTSIHLDGPRFGCSCPSHKTPCKHALSLLLLHADGAIPAVPETPGWIAPVRKPATNKDPKASRHRAEQREQRVASGMAELDQWLTDQVRQGLAATAREGYPHWDAIAARMVDAQCPAVAERLRSLAAAPHTGQGWEGRLLEELALLHLLAKAYGSAIPPGLRDTVRTRIGFTTRQADVIATGEKVTDTWLVLGWRDTTGERIRSRRVWLRGRDTDRHALVLSFALPGEPLDNSMPPGTQETMTLAYYPGFVPLRAAVVTRDEPVPAQEPAAGTIAELLDDWAAVLARDPWQESWPAIISGVPVPRPESALVDASGDKLPVELSWELLAVSGGHPVTVAVEYTPAGLHAMTAWPRDGGAPFRVQ